MEIYSPKKFQAASFAENKRVPSVKPPESVPENRDIIKNVSRESESVGERMRRVFYERLRAFFEYEEVT